MMAPPKDVPRTKLPALDASSATQSPTSFALAASMMESPMEDLGSPDIDPPFILFPEWTDADIAAEKWATKHAFEDPDSQQFFPRTLRGGLDHYKRPTEWIGESLTPIVVGTQAQLDDVFYGKIPLNGALIGFGATEAGAALNLDPTASQTDVSGPDQSNPEEVHSGSLASGGSLDPISVTQPPETLQPGSQHQSTQNLEDRSDSLQPPSQSLLQSTQLDESFNSTAQERESVDGLSKLFHVNRHLLKSELMTQILTCFHFFFDQSKTMKSVGTGDEFCLWDSIYPKNKDGSPMYNASGKYAVKLFWLGAWRKVIVDDRIPCSVDGKPLVITSPTIQELWPLIISKAILKLATYSYKDLSEFPEQGDFDTFYALRGWIPERLPVNGNENSALWNVLKGLNCKIYNFNAAKANAPASRASLLATNPALSMRASSFTPTDPYVVIFGFREALV